MPTITCYGKDIEKLFGKPVALSEWPGLLEKAKAEFKGYDEKTDELKVEIVDTNRPDLWSSEGLARQLRNAFLNSKDNYSFFTSTPGENEKITVDEKLKDIRPYVGGFLASNIPVDEPFLLQIIQTQEKHCENYGRSRELVSIGVYDASQITFPIRFKACRPDEIKFAPLEFTELMTLSEILDKHPKGQEYGHIVKGFSHYPILIDAAGKVLSFAPIINSNDLGKVEVGKNYLFVEATSTELEPLMLTMNILACNLADRGACIKPFLVEYPWEPEMSGSVAFPERKVITPQDLRQKVVLNHPYLEKLTGEEIAFDEVSPYLEKMGLKVEVLKEEKKFICTLPPYRRDGLHPVDIIEDFAISRGYNNFEPAMPEKYTIGSVAPVIEYGDNLRLLMIGMGFQEFTTYILTSRDRIFNKMNRPESKIIEVDNVMSDTYSILRPCLLPVLMEIESKNLRVEYPHRIFEEGEVVVFSSDENLGSKTLCNLAALISHGTASFSEIHSCLHSLMYYLGIPYELVEINDPAFIEGRGGKILCAGKEAGLMGEIHPQVLENYGITVPCAAFELTVDYLFSVKTIQ